MPDDGNLGEIVSQASTHRAWRTEIPNMVIDDARLTHYDRALYLHYKRVAGDGGVCFQGRAKLVEATGMDYDRLLASRAHLAECRYIVVTEQRPRPTLVEIVDVWAENINLFTKPRVTRAVDHQENPTLNVGSTSGKPDTKKDLRRSQKEERSGPRSIIEELGGKLGEIGVDEVRVDQICDLLVAGGYNGDDCAWIVAQGIEHGAKSVAYYREIMASNPPGIVERQEAERRKRRRPALPQGPAPRGASHRGMPLPPPMRPAEDGAAT